ncbi:SLAM family member 9-like isoform X10 [Suricata suricatta]|uniref:SLAM family member 9-like isoform X10 n=1 Tax=Suricata suricatta TaxID=37032 RepID=UPI001155BF63|nr:SLAM family member 9-like isoform X10 [Suricata suricatta]
MGARPEAPRRCWAPWLLGFTSLLLSAFSTVVRSPGAHGSDVEDSGSRISLKGTQGGSVVFHVIRRPDDPPEAELEKVSWAVKNKTNYMVLLRVSPGVDGPEWVNSRDKLERRVHVLNTTTLRMDKLTLEDSGWYQTRSSFTSGIESSQYFHLSVYEPVSHPQILAEILSLTPDWCNVTLECHPTGTTGAVTVSWESKGLPRELEQTGAPGPAPTPWTLALHLPLSRPSPSITCVVSNPVDQKTATWDLGEVCGHVSEGEAGPQGQAGACLLRLLLGSLGVVLLVLGAWLYLWCPRGERKRVEPGRGAGWQKHRTFDGGVPDAGQVSRAGRDKGLEEPHLGQETPLTPVYTEVRSPGQVVSKI